MIVLREIHNCYSLCYLSEVIHGIIWKIKRRKRKRKSKSKIDKLMKSYSDEKIDGDTYFKKDDGFHNLL